jgi:hypothetical protein
VNRACIASAFAATLLLSVAAQAQSFRAYLSVSGSDANPCTVAAPCRLLPAALNAVASGGEIWILDSANFNPGTVTITKSVSILAIPGAVGSFVAVGGTPALAITNVDVKLRNVVVVSNASSPGSDGIHITGGSLDITAAVIAVPGTGISATDAVVRVQDALLRDSVNGIEGFGSSFLEVTTSHFRNLSGVGVYGHSDTASANARMAVMDSSFFNVITGISAVSENATAIMKAGVSRCTFAVGVYGFVVQNTTGTGARGTVSGSSFTGMLAALVNNSAVLESTGDNTGGSTNISLNGGTTITNIPRF